MIVTNGSKRVCARSGDDVTMLSNLGVMLTSSVANNKLRNFRPHLRNACENEWGPQNCAIYCSPLGIIRTCTSTRTHTYDACDPFIIITPRFYNIIASSPDRTPIRTCTSTLTGSHTHTSTLTHDACDPFTTSSHHHPIAHTHTQTTYAIRL